MSEQKNTFIAGRKLDGKFHGAIECWTFAKKGVSTPYTTKTVNVSGNDKTVGNMTVTAPIHPSSVKYYFGDEFVPEEGKSIFIDVVAWERIAEQLLKYGPTLKQRLLLVGEISVQEYKTQSGNTGKKLLMNLEGFKPLTKKQGSIENQENHNDIPENMTPVEDDGELPF